MLLGLCSNLNDSRSCRFRRWGNKIKPQNTSHFLITTSELSRVRRSLFSLREILAHFSFVFLLHCFDCTQTHIIVAYLIRQGEPVIKWTFLSEKNRLWAKKHQRDGFFGVFTHYCTKKLRNFIVLL